MNDSQRGIILLTSIFLVLLISTIAIGYLALVNNQLEIADGALKSAQALYCADTGVSESILILKGIPDWTRNIARGQILADGDFRNGHYSVTIYQLLDRNKIDIKSAGKMSNFKRIILVRLYRDTINPLDKKIVVIKWEEI